MNEKIDIIEFKVENSGVWGKFSSDYINQQVADLEQKQADLLSQKTTFEDSIVNLQSSIATLDIDLEAIEANLALWRGARETKTEVDIIADQKTLPADKEIV